MTIPIAIAVAGVSFALASFIKYSFTYLHERRVSKIYEKAVNRYIEEHGDEIKEIIRAKVLERLGELK